MTDEKATSGCCCVAIDAAECARRRYGRRDCLGDLEPFEPSVDDPCDCSCHDRDEDDEGVEL